MMRLLQAMKYGRLVQAGVVSLVGLVLLIVGLSGNTFRGRASPATLSAVGGVALTGGLILLYFAIRRKPHVSR